MHAPVPAQALHVEEVLEAQGGRVHLAARFRVLVRLAEQVKSLRRGRHQHAAHGVRGHEHDLNAHADVVPAALVVLEGHVPLVVVVVVRRDGTLEGRVAGHVAPVDHLRGRPV